MGANKYEMKYDGTDVELSIKNIAESDSGIYAAVATSELGSVQSEAEVLVQVTLLISANSLLRYLCSSEQLLLLCR